MKINNSVLKNDERIIFTLRDLYSRYGYSRFKMSKFEEYDLYVRNKDFLISDSIITFTDTNGKLLALKPDVTFSLIKNIDYEAGTVQRFYYNENVYRVSKSTDTFKEIMQTGLECFGDIDTMCISEVISLAVKSLKAIDDDCILAVSNLDFISEMLEKLQTTNEIISMILKCISEKNNQELLKIGEDNELNINIINALCELIQLYGDINCVLPKVKSIISDWVSDEAIENFENITEILKTLGLDNVIKIDFSVINNMKYYNGIVFNGFINGISGSILSGGQYNKMMKRFKSKAGAIGFAVYLDLLDRFNVLSNDYDVDTVVLYESDKDYSVVSKIVDKITAEGNTVSIQRKVPTNIKYKKLLKIENGEVKTLENNA